MKKRIAALAAVCLFGCSRTITALTETSLEAGFDTILSYTEYTADKNVFTERFESCVRLSRSLSDAFDIYAETWPEDSLAAVNASAGIAPVQVSENVMEMLLRAKQMYDITGGAFDVTAGRLTGLWHAYREEGIEANNAGNPGRIPEEHEIQEAMAERGWSHIHLDPSLSTVYIDTPDISLDAGGIAKGYAAEQIAQYAEQDGAECAMVNAGHNIRTIGTKPSDKSWVIAIASVDDDPIEMARISLCGSMSFVTSGDYERFYTGNDGKRYHHITDMKTGYPADFFHSVTIIAEDSCDADALSTALFTVSVTEGRAILAAYEKSTGRHADAVWIMDPEKTEEAGIPCGAYTLIATEGIRDAVEVRR